MRSSTHKRIVKCEEWAKVPIDDKSGSLTRSDVNSIYSSWRGATRTDPLKYFEQGPGYLLPKFWSGTLHCGAFTFEVSPIGSLALSPSDRAALDKNLSEMLASVLGGFSVSGTEGHLSSNGSKLDALLISFCRTFHQARRVRVFRSYESREKRGATFSGRLNFPRQSILDVAAPGSFASTSLTFTEDTPENRVIAEVLRRFRPVCGPFIRRNVDACLGDLGQVSEGAEISKEWQRIRFDRLPAEYKTLMNQARALLDESFAGVLDGEVLATSEIVFTSRLFEKYVAQEVSRTLRDFSHELVTQSRGSHLCRTPGGQGAFELIPDILICKDKKFVSVADTKWKKISPERRGLGISPDDVYQILTYAGYFGCRRVALIFPNTSGVSGKDLFLQTLSSTLQGVQYDIQVIGLPLVSSIREGCREAARRLLLA